ncbi:OmpA family protein [Hydrogenophaga sp.]|uniref:OmpA family protein n=1 Tax=Hydrogenophaga sp. TaxID=1904254 RepID=UPI00272F65FE|nr:OmpA family protein [Hydrogenophaga sp.]MDP2075963.1 OmpA family protein [Hydrogenophaga sp.]MDP3109241.1 OmpA family protein [Hydrogenophaga sp.]MDP3349674.1 OmpA family protein [Hydrogenophaga sp.]MDZ4400599.1 OmpA family protein [Hydrogenophaga sp.]
MSSQDNEVEYRVVAVLLVAVIVLVTGFAVGLGIHKSRGGAPSTQMAAPAAVPAVAAASSDDASVVVENGVVKFYFASGKADLASGALVALGDAIAAANAGKQLVLSGFHDATGNPAFNAELAKQRALAVRDALVGAGVAETSMELKKPEQTTGTGNDAEARRVEVMIAG